MESVSYKMIEKKDCKYKLSFDIADRVKYYSKIGRDEGVVTGISIRQGGCISYAVTWSDKKEEYCYDFELELIS